MAKYKFFYSTVGAIEAMSDEEAKLKAEEQVRILIGSGVAFQDSFSIEKIELIKDNEDENN